MMTDMQPGLLMRAWMVAHLYGAKYQAVMCYAGSSGVVAFRESLRPQYTSVCHDAKGLRTFYITGTCGDTSISRIASGRIGRDMVGANSGPLHIAVTSNAHSWEGTYLSSNEYIVGLELNLHSAWIISNFLSRCVNLQRVNFEGLHPVVANGFLDGCSSLRQIDLSPFANLRVVGKHFLRGCSRMTSIDLTPLWDIDVLPDGFLSGCSGLQQVDLSPLANLRAVGEFFLCECSGMMSIDLPPLPTIEVLPNGFLFGCSGLEEVDLSPFTNLRVVGKDFLAGCSSITSIDLAPLRAIEVLPDCFLSGCCSLREIDLSPLVTLRAVGEFFLCECCRMTSIDLTPLRAIEVLPNGFLFGCSSLREIDLSPLLCLTDESGNGSFQECTSLRAVRLGPHQSDSILPKDLHGRIVREESRLRQCSIS